MKKINRLIKLTNLNVENLEESQLSHAVAGQDRCHCGCFWATCGGSSRYWNGFFNDEKGFVSPLPPDDVDCGIVT